MKKLSILLLLVSATALLGQGRVRFNNIVSWSAIYIYTPGGPGGGGSTVYVGGDYSVQLLWAPGTNYSAQEFYSAIQGASFPVDLWGTAGGSPNTDGAGLFDGGAVAIGPVGIYTMMARAWYNGGQYPTYEAAVSADANAGRSALFAANVTASPTPANNTLFPSFSMELPSPVLTPPPRPRLAIELTNGQAVVSWPYNPAYNLQTTTNFWSGNWLGITGPLPVVNGRTIVTNAISESARYFRLWR